MKRIDVVVPILGSVVIIVLVSIPLITRSVENVPTYLAGLAVIVTSWISLYFSVIRSVIRRPVLKTEVNSGTIIIEKKEGLKTYLRLKITNSGQMVAKNCVGRLLEIRDHLGNPVQYDPLYFFWARQDDVNVDFSPVQIYAGDSEYLDTVRIGHKEKTLKLRLSTKRQFVPQGVYFPLDDYYLLIGVYADDAVPYREWYQVVVNHESLSDSYLKKAKSPPNKRKS
jgi:hypothetical protein